jgi:acyl-CoA dehydrogenase
MRQGGARIDDWLARCPNPELDPLPGMREAGLLAPAPDYATIARLKASLVEHTGLLGVSSVWGGRQLVFRHFLAFGTEAQRAEWAGRGVSVAISEPKVGAHPKLLTTRADATGDGFRITGKKAWVTNGPSAEGMIVFAITAEEAGRKRYSAFIVPRDTPGLTTADMPGFHALRPSQHCLLSLEGCLVPASAMLGLPGTAYERMALPFRDIEDAVGTYSTLGALKYAVGLFAGLRMQQASEQQADAPDSERRQQGESQQTETQQTREQHAEKQLMGDLGAVVALIAVFEAGAASVVASLDNGRFRTGDKTLVGLRVLALDILVRLRAILSSAAEQSERGPSDSRLLEILSDLDATLAIARGPRLARQANLGAAALRSGNSAE